ncbi:hypothetical protein T4B_7391 [Trichinella pseudospiralis]|uniref:Uncharacterized protein n=1 Tax=Trichinella pseudospiralis TaxID=6337 RepID=A0A0V1IF16_TRIPS|nr:hypothetical protein T4B_7391 [Trichinella pseudospiralis]
MYHGQRNTLAFVRTISVQKENSDLKKQLLQDYAVLIMLEILRYFDIFCELKLEDQERRRILKV